MAGNSPHVATARLDQEAVHGGVEVRVVHDVVDVAVLVVVHPARRDRAQDVKLVATRGERRRGRCGCGHAVLLQRRAGLSACALLQWRAAARMGYARPMLKTKAAVLRELGRPGPYAQSKPLVIEEFDLAPPGPGEVLVRVRAAGLCHSDLSVIDGNRPRPLPMVLGHEMAGVVEAARPRRDGPAAGRSRRRVVRAELRRVRPLRGRSSSAVRTWPRVEHRRHAAVGRAPALPARHARQSSPRRVGLCRVDDGVAPLAGAGRSHAAVRGSGPLRLRGHHGRGRGRQHGSHAQALVARRDRTGRRRSRRTAGRAHARSHVDRRDRPQ